MAALDGVSYRHQPSLGRFACFFPRGFGARVEPRVYPPRVLDRFNANFSNPSPFPLLLVKSIAVKEAEKWKTRWSMIIRKYTGWFDRSLLNGMGKRSRSLISYLNISDHPHYRGIDCVISQFAPPSAYLKYVTRHGIKNSSSSLLQWRGRSSFGPLLLFTILITVYHILTWTLCNPDLPPPFLSWSFEEDSTDN